MHRYALTIAYDGTDYAGWQQQKNALSIQQIVKTALETWLRHTIRLIGSGRTDSGVHALGQVAHFSTEKAIEKGRFLYSINALLPPAIRLLDVKEVPSDFHAQHSATAKIYHYHLFLDPVLNPLERFYVWKPIFRVDKKLIKEAAPHFLGTHDFTTFANRGSPFKDPVRTLYRLDVIEQPGGLRLEFEGSGFLYKMVRNITGTLVAIGSQKLLPSDVLPLLAAKDRKKAPEGAPPQGLFLVKVFYGEDGRKTTDSRRLKEEI